MTEKIIVGCFTALVVLVLVVHRFKDRRWREVREAANRQWPFECFHCRAHFRALWQLDFHNDFHHPKPELEASNNTVFVRRSRA